MKNINQNIEKKISKIGFLTTPLIFNLFNVKDLKNEKQENLEKYYGTIEKYYRNFFIENISTEEINGKIKSITVNFINEERIPIHSIRNTRMARLILESTTPKNINIAKSRIILHYLDFSIEILYDIKSSSSTIILQYKINS